MPAIEKTQAVRRVPTSGTTEGIGALNFTDPITGDAIVQEQTSQMGFPTRFVKIAATVSAAGEYPDPAAITIATNANADQVTFSGAFGFGSPVGLLLWIKQAGSNQHRLRKIVGLNTGSTYDLNLALPTGLTAGDAYDILIDAFRYNALYVKSEFSGSGVACDVQPIFYSTPQGPENPTPSIVKPMRFVDRTFSIANSGINTDPEEASYYHGNIISIPSQGSIGMKVRIASISGGGSVSLWAGAV